MLTEAKGPRVPAFETASMQKIHLIDEIVPRYRTTYFNHIFSSDDYAAGYYSYIWAEVLDADAFEAFKKNGIFDAKTAMAFRKNILGARWHRGADGAVQEVPRRRAGSRAAPAAPRADVAPAARQRRLHPGGNGLPNGNGLPAPRRWRPLRVCRRLAAGAAARPPSGTAA